MSGACCETERAAILQRTCDQLGLARPGGEYFA